MLRTSSVWFGEPVRRHPVGAIETYCAITRPLSSGSPDKKHRGCIGPYLPLSWNSNGTSMASPQNSDGTGGAI